MKSYFFLIPLILCIVASSCGKRTVSEHAGTIYNGRVVKAMCGNIAVQFTDSSKLGQMNWIDDGVSYNHIFSVANVCTWGGAAEGQLIRFRFVPVVPQGCAVCLAYSPVPDTAYHIRVVQ